jgi:hypothetical protein
MVVVLLLTLPFLRNLVLELVPLMVLLVLEEWEEREGAAWLQVLVWLRVLVLGLVVVGLLVVGLVVRGLEHRGLGMRVVLLLLLVELLMVELWPRLKKLGSKSVVEVVKMHLVVVLPVVHMQRLNSYCGL